MSIIRFRPNFLDPFEEMDRFFGEDSPVARHGFVPALDVYQTKDSVIVETPLAGVDPDDVEISIDDNILTLKGETKRKSEVEEENFSRKEVRYGSFHRQIALPAQVIGEKAEAVSKDGMLKITIPKIKEAEVKSIKIKIAKQ
jgi:HSP20 family protein